MELQAFVGYRLLQIQGESGLWELFHQELYQGKESSTGSKTLFWEESTHLTDTYISTNKYFCILKGVEHGHHKPGIWIRKTGFKPRFWNQLENLG